MNLVELRPDDEQALRRRGASPRVILVVRLMATCLRDACRDVADDCGADRFDNATGMGGLRWQRAKERVVNALENGHIAGLAGVAPDVSENGLSVAINGTRVSFYSSPDGADAPRIVGSKRKRNLVHEMQLSLLVSEGEGLPQLVLSYRADSDGLERAVAGVTDSAHSFSWSVPAFSREESGAAESAGPPVGIDHDEQEEPSLPPISPKEESDEDEEAGGEALGRSD